MISFVPVIDVGVLDFLRVIDVSVEFAREYVPPTDRFVSSTVAIRSC
jgi:hypothetical protein